MSALLLAFLVAAVGTVFAQPSPAAKTEPEAALETPVNDEARQPEQSFTLENSLNLRDPFRRFTPSKHAGVEGGGNIPELERYELDTFKLAGVITGPKKNKALVISKGNSKMHVISEGMRIGTRRGLIKKIAPNVVLVEEKVVNLLGQEEAVETSIEFEKKDKEKEIQAASGVGNNGYPDQNNPFSSQQSPYPNPFQNMNPNNPNSQ